MQHCVCVLALVQCGSGEADGDSLSSWEEREIWRTFFTKATHIFK